MNSHKDCQKCNHDKMSASIDNLRELGYTWSWTANGKTRQKKRWFGRGSGMKTQIQEVKIDMPPEMFPIAVYRWRTVK